MFSYWCYMNWRPCHDLMRRRALCDFITQFILGCWQDWSLHLFMWANIKCAVHFFAGVCETDMLHSLISSFIPFRSLWIQSGDQSICVSSSVLVGVSFKPGKLMSIFLPFFFFVQSYESDISLTCSALNNQKVAALSNFWQSSNAAYTQFSFFCSPLTLHTVLHSHIL